MINDIDAFYEASRPLIAAFDGWAAATAPAAAADHLCYKCGDAKEFERLRALFEARCPFLYQSLIAGRRIAVIRLPQPIDTALGEIRFLELSDQKPDGSQASGFDHVEIHPVAGSAASLVAALEAGGAVFVRVVRPHHTTFDAPLPGGFKVRIEPEPLIDKIKAEEMR